MKPYASCVPVSPGRRVRAFAPRIGIPTLFVMSPEDESPFAVSAATRAVFDRLTGPKAQAEWLSRTLGTTP